MTYGELFEIYSIGYIPAALTYIAIQAIENRKLMLGDILSSFLVGLSSWFFVCPCFIGSVFYFLSKGIEYIVKHPVVIWQSKHPKPQTSKDYSGYTGSSIDDSYEHGYE